VPIFRRSPKREGYGPRPDGKNKAAAKNGFWALATFSKYFNFFEPARLSDRLHEPVC
jgi:hypothetical protein